MGQTETGIGPQFYVCGYCGWSSHAGIEHDCPSELRKCIERLRKERNDLWQRLLRADPVCENMHHNPSEYHRSDEPCPVEAWVRKGFPNEEGE
jgi:hypothetical protein